MVQCNLENMLSVMPWWSGNRTPLSITLSALGYPSSETLLAIVLHIGCRKILPVKTTLVWIFLDSRYIWKSFREKGALSLIKIGKANQAVLQPGGQGEKSGGQREFVEYLSRAAVAVGVAGVFIETHQDPDNAPSDGPNMVPLDKLEDLLKQLNDIDNLIKN